MKMPYALVFALAIGGLPIAAHAESGSASATPPAAANAIVGPALYVTDMTRSLAFYRDILGMTVRMQFGPPEQPDVVIGFGGDPSAPGLMLLSDRADPAPRKIQHGHGYDRFALRTAGLAGLQTKLREAGFQTEEIKEAHGAFLVMMATDPDGYTVELIADKSSG